MKRTSRIFLRVGAIVSLVLAGIFLLCGVTFLIISLPFFVDVIRDGVSSGEISTSVSPDAAVALWLSFSISTCVIFLVLAAFAVVNGILGFKCLKAPNKKLLVTTIVLSGTELTSVGAILGIISLNREKKD